MRIAIATDWFPPRRGGIEAQVGALAERLAARGHEVVVITSTPGAINGAGYSVRRLDGLRLPGSDVLVSPRLSRQLRTAIDHRVDVVHSHVSVVSPVGYLAAVAAASRHVPTVLTFHSVLKLKRFVLSAANVAARVSARPLVWSAVSELVATQVGDALGVRDVMELPNGIDLRFWSDTTDVPRAADPVTFVSAMRLHRKKRPRQLIASFARAVARTNLPARLVIAGIGPELTALRRDVARLREGRVDLVGWQDRASLRALYAQADAFVLPTRHESFGIAALEARAAGLPVVVSRFAGCREFLRHDHDAMLCDDDDDFATAMARLIREPELRRRLARAQSPLDRYDWSSVVGEHERAYDRAMTLIARARAPAAASPLLPHIR